MNENESILLRALEPDDVELLYEWENNREIWRVSNTHTPFSKYILRKYIENSHLDIYQTRQLRLMIERSRDGRKESIGCVDIFDYEPFHARAGIGILIADKANRDKGYATKALEEIVHYAFTQLDLHQLYCNITVDNMPSIRLFENAGFNKIGVKREWIKGENGFADEMMYQLVRAQENQKH
jgi:diamine N-acetyltransferase